MAVVDRTDEFFKTAHALVSAGVRPVSTLSQTPDRHKRSPTEEARAFTLKAAEISQKIKLTSRRLQQLAELTRRQGTFDDPLEEINTLAARVKNDTKFLKIELDQLQAYLRSHKQQVGRGSANAVDHSQTVVDTMQVQLVGTARDFKSVLEARQSSVRKKNDRRGLFGAKRAPLSASRAPVPTLAADNAPAQRQEQQQPRQQLAQMEEADVVLDMQMGNGDFDDDAALAPLIEHAQATAQDDSYLSSRAEAMTSIESHISELGDVFSQLAVMVAEQGGMVQRIDDNVRDAQDNLTFGHEQLLRTWANVSNNKWLAAKILFVLLFFSTFFVVFLA